MIAAIKSNPVTTIFGILTVISEIFRSQPDLLDFLPENIRGYIFGTVSVSCAIITAIAAKDGDTNKQILAKSIAKKIEKEQLKQEIINNITVNKETK